ncbi:hypothetical protein [uncultured Campylobacter sp.]|uniref:hypothetical protein n=1 Tax=uncultured Campylobacter sp. TaxID=218934 RepID=UPI0026251EC8|nr:hypothetical protein [uncultured Campylobacter sp.]
MKILNSIFGKLAILLGSVFFGATQAMADVTFADGKFSGTIDSNPFTSAVVVVIGLIGLIYAVKAGLALLRR